jgi:hypothetical protein
MSVARIRKAAEEADQMIQGLHEVPSEPEAQEETPAAAPETDQGVSAEAPPTETPDDAGEVDHAPSVDSADTDWRHEAQLWEQRYRSLNGMIQSRDKQIQQLHELLANMQQVRSESQQASPSEPVDSLITKDDEDSYGADLVDMARRAGRQESMQLINEMKAELANMRESLQGVSQFTQKSVKERFEAKLDDVTKNRWRNIDRDPAFINWLKASNARYKVFSAGVQELDADTVAEFFNEYVKLAAPAPTTATQPSQSRKAELEKQVAPGKSKAGAAPISQAGDKKVWTRTEIAQLYANKRQYAADEFNKLERDVAAAQREGRVDFNK